MRVETRNPIYELTRAEDIENQIQLQNMHVQTAAQTALRNVNREPENQQRSCLKEMICSPEVQGGITGLVLGGLIVTAIILFPPKHIFP